MGNKASCFICLDHTEYIQDGSQQNKKKKTNGNISYDSHSKANLSISNISSSQTNIFQNRKNRQQEDQTQKHQLNQQKYTKEWWEEQDFQDFWFSREEMERPNINSSFTRRYSGRCGSSKMSCSTLIKELCQQEICSASQKYNMNETVQAEQGELTASEFKILKIISESDSCKVYLCERNAVPLAFKQIPVNFLHEAIRVERLLRERRVFNVVSSPCTVRLEFAFSDETYVYLVTDYKPNGTLRDRIDLKIRHNRMIGHSQPNRQSVDDIQGEMDEMSAYIQKQVDSVSLENIQHLLGQIVVCLDYLHSKNILYRGLQAENVLFDELDNVSLCDFGNSKIIEGTSVFKDVSNSFVSGMREENLSPEQSKSYSHGVSSDYWQLGVLAYEIVYGRHPYKGETNEQTVYNIQNCDAHFESQDANGQEIPISLREFINLCLQRSVRKRPRSFYDIQQIGFFTDFDWQQVLENYSSSYTLPSKTHMFHIEMNPYNSFLKPQSLIGKENYLHIDDKRIENYESEDSSAKIRKS